MAKRKTASKKRSDFASAKAFKAYKARSQASKLAWRERKRTALRAEIMAAAPIRGLEPITIPTGLSVSQLEKMLVAERDARVAAEAEAYREKLTAGFVDSEELHKLRKNMAIAVSESRLRHLGEVTDVMEKNLKKASKKGERALRKLAREYSDYFDVPLREVYTLFFSP